MIEEPLAALQAAVASGDVGAAVEVLEVLAHDLHSGLHPQRLVPLVEPLATLPIGDRPYAALTVALVLREAAGDGPDVETIVESCESAFEAADDPIGSSYCAFLRGNQAMVRGDLVVAGNWWRRAMVLSPDGGWVRASALAHLALVVYFESGDLREAHLLAEDAVALSRQRQDRRTEVVALVYAAFLGLSEGSFGPVESILDLADDLFDELVEDQRPERPLLDAARAVLAAFRGQHAVAECHFERALHQPGPVVGDWYEAMILALRAEFTAVVNPRRATADARAAKDICRRIGDQWWWTWAERAQGLASAALGQFRTAEATLEHLLAQPLNPVERGRTWLALAETRSQAGEQAGASTAFAHAAKALEGTGARYYLYRALHGHAAVAPRRRARLLAQAAQLYDDDVAFRLVRGLSSLQVEVLGVGRVLVVGVPARFASRKALLLVCALATMPSGALHSEKLIDRLWPDATLERGRASLRTAMWEARRALGPEAWRLHRKGDLVLFDGDGVAVDLFDARAEARELLASASPDEARLVDLVRRLDVPVLQGSSYDDWVVALDTGRVHLLDRLRSALATPLRP